MKFQLLPISLLVTLFFSLISNAATLDFVYDINGHALIPGKEYYILPLIRGRGGGLTITQHNHKTCPLYVAQENIEVNSGYPLTFHPANPNDTAVHLSTDINIVFSIMTTCVQPTGWRLGNAEETAQRRHIILGAFTGNPGRKTVSNWFKIEKWGSKDYKLVFCPSVCKTCKVLCGDLGVFNEGGKRLLGLGGKPFPVLFKRKDSGS